MINNLYLICHNELPAYTRNVITTVLVLLITVFANHGVAYSQIVKKDILNKNVVVVVYGEYDLETKNEKLYILKSNKNVIPSEAKKFASKKKLIDGLKNPAATTKYLFILKTHVDGKGMDTRTLWIRNGILTVNGVRIKVEDYLREIGVFDEYKRQTDDIRK